MIDADTFLQTIFDQCSGVVVTCSDRFITRRWVPGQPIPADQVYFCISTVKDPGPRIHSRISRKAQDLVLTWVVVLDDVGTKITREKILCLNFPPTYKILTSQPDGLDNEQWGYIFDEGVEPARAGALIEALAAKGLTDPGAKGAARVMRFPGSLNQKYDPPFAARLIEWHPERLFSYVEVCRGLDVTPTDTPPMDAPGTSTLPDGVSDALFQWLCDRGLVRSTGPNARGYWDIACPQEHLHSPGTKTKPDDVGYIPGLPGIFKCQHGHCTGLNVHTLRAWAQEQDPTADLSLMSGKALLAIGAKLRTRLGAIEVPGGKMVAGEEKSLAEAVLADLVHVASEDKFWSCEADGLLKGSAVDMRLHADMLGAGLLDKTLRSPTIWLKHHAQMQKVRKLVHRLGAARIVDGCLNIAPALPQPVEFCGEPAPWLELISFICKGNLDDIEWLLDWMAMVVTDWTEKPGFHVILKGRQGTGKNLAMMPLVRYLQPDHHQLVAVTDIERGFTGFLTKRLVSVDELKMTARGSATPHDVYNNIKAWTARGAPTIAVRFLYRDHIEASNLSAWAITSNELVPLPLEDDDRRFMVIETPARKMPKEYYQRIVDWLVDGGGQAQVIGWLQCRWAEMSAAERTGLRMAAPMTDAKAQLIDDASEGIEGAVRQMISGRHGEAWPDLMSVDDALAKLEDAGNSPLTDSMRRNHLNRKRVSMALRSVGAVQLFDDAATDGTRRVRLWCMRPHKAEHYALMGRGKALLDAYENQRNGIVSKEMSNVFKLKPHT